MRSFELLWADGSYIICSKQADVRSVHENEMVDGVAAMVLLLPDTLNSGFYGITLCGVLQSG